MPDWKIKKMCDCPASVWSGGITWELHLDPQDGNYAERHFDLRISSASVETDESRFTSLPGFNRLIASLNHPMILVHPDHPETVELAPFEWHAFSGDETTLSRGRVQDFNILYNAVWDICPLLIQENKPCTVHVEAGSEILLFSTTACTLYANNKDVLKVPEYALISTFATANGMLQLQHDGSAPLIGCSVHKKNLPADTKPL